MNEVIKKIQTGFGKSLTVTDVFKMGDKYLVHVAPKGHEEESEDGFYEYDPKVNNVKEFAMFNRKADFMEAVKHKVYDYKTAKHSVEDDEGLKHFGVLHMKHGVRRWQNEDGSLTPAGRIHYGRQLKKWNKKGYLNEDGSLNEKGYTKLSKKDEKWSVKNHDKIMKYAMTKSKKEMADFRRYELNPKFADQIKNGKVGLTYVNAYNKKLAEVLTKNVSHIKTPNLEKTISFIARRGELGAAMAVSDQGYDLSKYKRGIYRGGRVAYRKDVVNQIDTNKK